MARADLEFEGMMDQFTPMIHHIIHKLRIRDPYGEFYQEGVLALWEAVQSFQEDKGKLSSYVYFIVRNRLISKMRKDNRLAEKDEQFALLLEEEAVYYDQLSFNLIDPYVYKEISRVLTDNQLKWFDGFILREQALQEIADKENTTLNAVKNWGRLAKEKLRNSQSLLDYLTA
ncbi:sigma-70 family RNA polymerase sigma factor [Pontibacillus salipaludis]|uniref:sigma-70 family RNA polymerase sigma factor n=1 Tax=Pontibacillus salipaludis TaxID=1697394 RepID=UPI0031EE47B9